MRSMTLAGISRMERTGKPGPEGSMIRTYLSQLQQRVMRLAIGVIGRTQTVMSARGQG